MKISFVLTVLIVALLPVCGCTGTRTDETGDSTAPIGTSTETTQSETSVATVSLTPKTVLALPSTGETYLQIDYDGGWGDHLHRRRGQS